MKIKDILLLGLPILFGRFRKKNPKADEIKLAVMDVFNALENPHDMDREEILHRLDAELVKRGWSPETRAIARFYAEQKLDKLGI